MVEIICNECKKKVEMPSRRFKLCVECKHLRQRSHSKKYKMRNKQAIAEYNKKYKEENKEQIKKYNQKYDKENREIIQKRQTARAQERRKTDPKYKMSIVIRNRFRKFYNGNTSTSMLDLVGCNSTQFMKWIEYNFTADMTFENHGIVWHIDHVLPCSLFDLRDYSERKICFNWKNTRPLLASKNMSRKNSLEIHDILNHEIRLKYFEQNNWENYDHIYYDLGHLTTKLRKKLCNGFS